MDLEAEGEMKSRYLRRGIWPFAGTVIYQSHSTNDHQWQSARRLQDKTSIRLFSSSVTPLTHNSTPANQQWAAECRAEDELRMEKEEEKTNFLSPCQLSFRRPHVQALKEVGEGDLGWSCCCFKKYIYNVISYL